MRYTMTPTRIATLPFNSLRSKLYPDNPPTAQQAVRDQLAGRHSQYMMPQSVLQTKWQVPHPQTPGAAAAGAIEASLYNAHRTADIAMRGTRNVTMYPWQQAAQPLNQLPNPQLRIDLYPISRGVADHPMISARQLDALSQSAQGVPQPQTQTATFTRRSPLLSRYRVQVY